MCVYICARRKCEKRRCANRDATKWRGNTSRIIRYTSARREGGEASRGKGKGDVISSPERSKLCNSRGPTTTFSTSLWREISEIRSSRASALYATKYFTALSFVRRPASRCARREKRFPERASRRNKSAVSFVSLIEVFYAAIALRPLARSSQRYRIEKKARWKTLTRTNEKDDDALRFGDTREKNRWLYGSDHERTVNRGKNIYFSSAALRSTFLSLLKIQRD